MPFWSNISRTSDFALASMTILKTRSGLLFDCVCRKVFYDSSELFISERRPDWFAIRESKDGGSQSNISAPLE